MIYIVEDDENIRLMESYALKNSGFQTVECESGDAFFAACQNTTPQLIVLDVMLPGEDGLTLLRRIRQSEHLKSVPVVMVTAKTAEMDAVKALDSGADDYIAKPFGVMEFISRVKAVLRRTQRDTKDELCCGKISLSDQKHLVFSDQEPVDLTYKEFELLKLLLHNKNVVLSRDKIMDKVWGTDYQGESRNVDMHIKTLRKKLGVSGDHIKTVRNVGYKIEE